MAQETIDRIHREEVVRQHIEQFGVPTSVTGVSSPGLPSSPVVVADEADLSVHSDSESTHEEATIDQSVNGISFINLHWASISTGISSILAVVVLCLIIAGCCYFRGRRQRQSRARHAELLRNLATGRHTSTPVKVQSGAYPGPSSSDVIHADPFIFDSPGHPSVFDSPISGPVVIPAIQFSASSASCGLPGCATKYQHQHSSQPIPSAPQLSVAYSARHPRALEFIENRSTGMHSLSS